MSSRDLRNDLALSTNLFIRPLSRIFFSIKAILPLWSVWKLFAGKEGIFIFWQVENHNSSTTSMNLYQLGDYEKIFNERFNCSSYVDYSSVGDKIEIEKFIVPKTTSLTEFIKSNKNTIRRSLTELEKLHTNEPFWIKVNNEDNAANVISCMGFLNLRSDWKSLILNILEITDSEQGDSCFISIFDREFKWVFNIDYYDEDRVLVIEKYEKQRAH